MAETGADSGLGKRCPGGLKIRELTMEIMKRLDG